MRKFLLGHFARNASNYRRKPLVVAVVALLGTIIITQPTEHDIYVFTRELLESKSVDIAPQ